MKNKLKIPSVDGYTIQQVDSAARALREHAGFSVENWDTLPNSTKAKYWAAAAKALSATKVV